MKSLITAVILTTTAATTASAFNVTISLGGSTTYGHEEITLQQVHEQGLVQTWEQRNKYLSWWKWRKAQALGLIEDKKILEADLSAANSNISSLTAEVADLEADKATLEAEMETLEADVVKYTNLYNSEVEAHEAVAAKLVSVEQELDSAMDEINTKNVEIAKKNAKIAELKDEVAELEADYNNAVGSYFALKDQKDAEIAELEDELDNTQAWLDSANADLYALSNMSEWKTIHNKGYAFTNEYGVIDRANGESEFYYRQHQYHVNGVSGGDGDTRIGVEVQSYVTNGVRIATEIKMDGKFYAADDGYSIGAMTETAIQQLDDIVEQMVTDSYNEGYKDGFEAGFQTGYNLGVKDAKAAANVD